MRTIESDILIIGGGAAGFFAAINCAENNPSYRIIILEGSNKVLSKVRISGGGRCNVTHAEYVPQDLVLNYPRGEKELLGPFHKFMTGDVIEWFESRGVPLKSEKDGRVFPVTDDSQTIIDCFTNLVHRLGIEVITSQRVTNITNQGDRWEVETKERHFMAFKVMVATGSDVRMWNLLENLGHHIIPPVPSLFTFNIDDDRIRDLPGIAVDAKVRVVTKPPIPRLESSGPLLITHWGMSGPAVLKLSAWGARILSECQYRFEIEVNWLGHRPMEKVLHDLKSARMYHGKHVVFAHPMFGIPRRLWQNLVVGSGIDEHHRWGEITGKNVDGLATQLTRSIFSVNGKSTFKEEFVTAGGVDLKEINFRNFESKLRPGLFLAGEVLNIDAVTGGFNFQNAWTGAYLAARAMAE